MSQTREVVLLGRHRIRCVARATYRDPLEPGLRRIRAGFRNAVCAVDEHIYPHATALGPAMQPLTAIVHGVRTRLEEPVAPRARIVLGTSHDDLAGAIRVGAQVVFADSGSLGPARAEIARHTAGVGLYNVGASLPMSEHVVTASRAD